MIPLLSPLLATFPSAIGEDRNEENPLGGSHNSSGHAFTPMVISLVEVLYVWAL